MLPRERAAKRCPAEGGRGPCSIGCGLEFLQGSRSPRSLASGSTGPGRVGPAPGAAPAVGAGQALGGHGTSVAQAAWLRRRSPQSPAAGNGGQKTGETPQASGHHVCECSAELGRDPGLRRPGWGRGFAGVQGDRPPAVMEGEPAGVAPTPRRPVLLGRVSAPSDAQRVAFLQELFPSSSPPRPVTMLGHRSPGLRLWAPGTASLAAPHRGLTSSDPPAVCLNHAGCHFIC